MHSASPDVDVRLAPLVVPAAPVSGGWRTAARYLLGRLASLTPMGAAYAAAAAAGEPGGFASRALDTLQIGWDVRDATPSHVPARGPLIVVANHPCGALDGLLLLAWLSGLRHDVKVLGNPLLACLPALRPALIPLNPFGSPASVARNAASLRASLRWLRGGGALICFPAGEVAHTVSRDGVPHDAPWHTTPAELAVRAGATVVPVFVSGANSRLFRAAGHVHALARTLLLPRELWAQRGAARSLGVGAAVSAHRLRGVGEAEARTVWLRRQVEALARPVLEDPVPTSSGGREGRVAPPHDGVRREAPRDAGPPSAHAIASRGDAAAIRADVAALGVPLVTSGAFDVYCAEARQLPAVLPEIGRLREVAFRQAGEGTGMPRDLDVFDAHYRHLFVWDRQACEIAGAYRLGETDRLVARGGVGALYTRTLFDYDRRLVEALGPSLELGRAFVQPAYQREFSPLLLLWRGISRFVAARPRYRRLFGVVSISDAYETTSRQMLMTFLERTCLDAELSRLVTPLNPPPGRDAPGPGVAIDRLDDLSALVRRIERDGKDIPVLLRQYLKLNARLLGFSVDASFGGVLDGLVVVDLADVEPAILSRLMGRDEASRFLEGLRTAGTHAA